MLQLMQLKTVGEIVRLLRSRLGLEQVQLAHACGWHDASAVSRIEKDHVHPTRRTLAKIAENLADPAITGTSEEIRAWLFLAAGVLPTAREVEELGARIPDIETLPHPASILDFGWYLWRANEWFRKGVGLPERHIGRNYIEMFFEQDGSVRKQLGDLWVELAPVLIGQFREDTAHRTEQRWFGKLLTTLRTLPDFEGIWNDATAIDANEFGWSHTSIDGGMVGAVRSQLSADPRLIIGHIVPEDPDGRTQMLKRGAFLG
jgi:transcriptional regulator with XRE-family HTH domain